MAWTTTAEHPELANVFGDKGPVKANTRRQHWLHTPRQRYASVTEAGAGPTSASMQMGRQSGSLERPQAEENFSNFGRRCRAVANGATSCSSSDIIAGSVGDSDLSPNFAFLAQHDRRLALLATHAERSFHLDPLACLMRLRQLCEALAEEAGACVGIRFGEREDQLDRLRRLADTRVLPREVAERSIQPERPAMQPALYALEHSREIAIDTTARSDRVPWSQLHLIRRSRSIQDPVSAQRARRCVLGLIWLHWISEAYRQAPEAEIRS